MTAREESRPLLRRFRGHGISAWRLTPGGLNRNALFGTIVDDEREIETFLYFILFDCI